MEQPLISVIIPAYNVENYIIDCLETVVFQTYGNLEVIVIDDGSTDNTLEKIADFAKIDKRVLYFSQQNKGLSEARNKGLRLAAGEYVAFVDGDDMVNKDFIKSLYEAMNRQNADIAVCSYTGARKAVKTETVLSREEALSDFLTQRLGTGAVVWNKLYKREVVKVLRFPKDRLHEDNFFTPHALEKANSVVAIPDELYYYRKTDGITSKMTKKRRKDALDSIEDTKKLLKRKKLDKTLEKELEAYELNQKFYLYKLSKNAKLKAELKAKKHEILKNPYTSRKLKLNALMLH